MFGTGLGHLIPTIAYLGFWVMCVVSLTGRPLYGLYYVMPFLPYRTMREHFADYPLSSQTVTILVVCILIGAFIKGKRPPPSRMYLTWVLFALYMYLSMWIGTALGNAPAPLWLSDNNFVLWKDYMVLPLLLVAAGMVIETRQHLRTVLILIAVSLFLVDRSALLESLSHSWAVFDENKRTSGPIAYGPNQLAAFLAQFGMFFWGCAAVLKRFRVKVILYGLTGLTMVTTLYAFSRAAYIAVLVAVAVLALLKDRKLLLVLAVFMVTWKALVPAAVSERVDMTHNSSGQLESSAQERVDLWEQSKDMFVHSPVVGIGFGAFMYSEHTADLKDTHNYYVKVLVEMGLIGFAIFGVLVFQMVSTGFRVFRKGKGKDPLFEAVGLGFVLAMVTSLVANGFGDRWTYVEINGLLWVLMGGVLRADVLLRDPETGKPAWMRNRGSAMVQPPRLTASVR
ncbi:O-antigen ligase family protein [Terriglobus sp.]|uniref:O-antigen ligase family protein n=1 Tax=Terriglobus sp. TaxID=1889013 RepID=UPI003B00ECAD